MINVKLIKLIVIDVDGTLTDAGIYYDENGNEWKKFNTRDAAGFFAAKQANIGIMILTGRESKSTLRRMHELKVDYCIQNIKEKKIFLESFMKKNNLRKEQVAFIGDDLNDISSMNLAGFVGCPADACEEVKNIADYVSTKEGGNGAVRDIIKYLLCLSNQWEQIISIIYEAGI